MTDFGDSEYVGVMKGVILSLCPTAEIVDLTHSIPSQSIIEGAWVLYKSYQYFPKGTIFVVVVDPGVGTDRDSVVVKTQNYTFVGPDNGLLYPAATDDGIVSVSSIVVEPTTSRTFHGRDVFARMAAFILRNQADRMLGGFKPSLSVTLEFNLQGRSGVIVRIDKFGNIITNIPPLTKGDYILRTIDLRWDISWHPTYHSGPEYGVFLVTGSYDTLEIAAKDSSAADEIPLKVGDRLTIE
ncbi:MAG: S-adenosyl-l-methionine hydroxide adenosyltransferase family protein [Candidatus Thorarchaeota archaeon]